MTAALTHPHAQAALTRLGWAGVPFARAVAGFQQGYALGPALRVDALYGPLTGTALAASIARLDAGKPTASKWFSFNEFACRCTGTCQGEAHLPAGAAPTSRIWVRRPLLLALDRLRDAHYPRGLVIESGCRCWTYHEALYRRLGKPVTTTSMHLYGGAADLEHHVVPLASARALRLFSGIGYQSSQPGQPMSHADVRHAVGDMLHRNPRMRTPSNPEVWAY